MNTRGKIHPPHLAWGIVAFIVFISVAAVGFYRGTLSRDIMERTPLAQSTTGPGK